MLRWLQEKSGYSYSIMLALQALALLVFVGAGKSSAGSTVCDTTCKVSSLLQCLANLSKLRII